MRNPARPRVPRLPPHGAGGAGVSLTQRNTLRRALAPVPRGRLSPPRRGGGRPATAPLRLAWPLCWCPWSAPGRLSGARGRAGGVVSRSRRSLRRGHPRRKLCRGVGGGGAESVRWRGSPLPRPLGRGVPCRSRSRVPSLPWVGEVARERRPGPAFGGAHPALPRASSTVAVSSRAPCEARGPGEASAGGEPGRQHRPPRVLGRDGPGWPSHLHLCRRPFPWPPAYGRVAGVPGGGKSPGWGGRRPPRRESLL